MMALDDRRHGRDGSARQTVPCHRCQKPVLRSRAVRREDGELYHLDCPGKV